MNKELQETTFMEEIFEDGCNGYIAYQKIYRVTINKVTYIVKIYINTDSQYGTEIEVFDKDSLEWKTVYAIPESIRKTPSKTRSATYKDFASDIETLKTMLFNILS